MRVGGSFPAEPSVLCATLLLQAPPCAKAFREVARGLFQNYVQNEFPFQKRTNAGLPASKRENCCRTNTKMLQLCYDTTELQAKGASNGFPCPQQTVQSTMSDNNIERKLNPSTRCKNSIESIGRSLQNQPAPITMLFLSGRLAQWLARLSYTQ